MTGVREDVAGIVMDLIEYFERQKQRCERELTYTEAPSFQLIAKTAQDDQDVTLQHIQQLRDARDDYQRMTEHLKAQDLAAAGT